MVVAPAVGRTQRSRAVPTVPAMRRPSRRRPADAATPSRSAPAAVDPVRRGGQAVHVVAAQRREAGVETAGGRTMSRTRTSSGRNRASRRTSGRTRCRRPASPGDRRCPARGWERRRGPPDRWRAHRRRCAPAARSCRVRNTVVNASSSTPATVRCSALDRPARELRSVVGDIEPKTTRAHAIRTCRHPRRIQPARPREPLLREPASGASAAEPPRPREPPPPEPLERASSAAAGAPGGSRLGRSGLFRR